MSLPDCFIMLNWIFSQYWLNCTVKGVISWFTHSWLYFRKILLNLWSLKEFFFLWVWIMYFIVKLEFMKFSVQLLSISSWAEWLLTLTQIWKFSMSIIVAIVASIALSEDFNVSNSEHFRLKRPSSFLN